MGVVAIKDVLLTGTEAWLLSGPDVAASGNHTHSQLLKKELADAARRGDLAVIGVSVTANHLGDDGGLREVGCRFAEGCRAAVVSRGVEGP